MTQMAGIIEPLRSPTVLYHAACHDGVSAAWAARQKWPEAHCIPTEHHAPLEMAQFTDKDVVMVDVTWSLGAMIELGQEARSLLVIDHHVTARPILAALNGITLYRNLGPPCVVKTIYDVARSGAGLAWDELVGGPRPPMIKYVEDRDLWKFRYPETRPFHFGCNVHAINLETRTWLFSRPVEEVIADGEIIAKYHDKVVKGIVAAAQRRTLSGFENAAIVACPIEFASDVGHELCNDGASFAAMYREASDGTMRWSLRSADGGADVGAIATEMGGGGHKHAAGFTKELGWTWTE